MPHNKHHWCIRIITDDTSRFPSLLRTDDTSRLPSLLRTDDISRLPSLLRTNDTSRLPSLLRTDDFSRFPLLLRTDDTYRFPLLLRTDDTYRFPFFFFFSYDDDYSVFIQSKFIPILTTMLIPFSFNRSSFRFLRRWLFRLHLIEVHSDPYNDAHSVFF